MILFCIEHNRINTDGRWEYPKEDVEEILRRKQQLAKMEKCPECSERVRRIKHLMGVAT